MKSSSFSFFSLCFGITVGALLLLSPDQAEARPEYMVKHGVVSCTACHSSPAGGGIRNRNGKLYGAHGYETSAHHLNELYQLDYRAILYAPEERETGRGGLGLMAFIGSINIPVAEDQKSKTNFVSSYSLGGFLPGLREAYIRNEFKAGQWIEHILVGLFNPAFGLMTDEHRTYTRSQSMTTFNQFVMGAMVSGRLSERTHYDLAVTQGFQTTAQEGSGNFSAGPTSGAFANLRWMPARVPLMLGASGRYNERNSGQTKPYAYSAYSGLSLDRLTGGKFPSQILLEVSRAQFWNESLINPEFKREFFAAADATYLAALINSASQAASLYWHYDWSPHLTLTYKFDHLIPAVDFPGDYFQRHGIGFKYASSANLQWNFRAEKSQIGRPDLSRKAPGAQDAVWALAHYWF